MKTLMVGIQDVTSEYIADRLGREGSPVTWFTAQRKEGKKTNIRVKIYHREYDVRSILRVLQMQDIDTVVFHYGSYRGTAEEEKQDESRIPALQCLLSAMEIYGKVSRLVYISTMELNHENIRTPRMAEMRYGEALVEHYAQNRIMSAVILRTGIVFGQGRLSGMGYVGRTIQKVLNGQTAENRSSPDSLIDLVYAGDVAMAVFRLLSNECSGTYYCLTGSPISMKKFHDMLGGLLKLPVKIRYYREEETLPAEEYLSLSQSLRMETGWFPLCLVQNERGIQEFQAIAEQALAGKEKTESAGKEKFSFYKWIKEHSFLRGLAETFLIFALTMFISRWTEGNSDMRYVDVQLLFVVLISIQYGLRLGIVAVALACMGYVHSLRVSGIDIAYLFYGVETWIPFIVYALCGAAIGYVTDLRADNMAEIEEKNEMLRDRYDFLKELQKETIEVKQQLQQQLSASRESFGKVYQISERLNTLSPNQMLYSAVDVLSEVMGNCQSAIWMLNDTSRFARRKACTNDLVDVMGGTMVMTDYPLIAEGFAKENLFVNRNLEPGYPDFAVPIYRDNRPIAFAALYQVKPDRFSVYYQNLFKVVVGLIENNLIRAMVYADQTMDQMYLPDTMLLNEAAFSEALKLAGEEQKKGHVSFLLLRVNQEGFSLGELSERLVSLIRADDMAGIDEEGRLCVLLMNAVQEDLEPIKKRFASKGVEVEVC